MYRILKPISLALLTVFSMSAFSQQLQLGQANFGGNACNNSNARATLSPDGRQISILLDNFIAEAGNRFGPFIDRKNCDISIPVKVPQGYSIALFNIDYRGFALVPSGGKLRFSADYYFAGKSSRRYSKEFFGPMNDNFIFQNEIKSDVNVWSACGAEVQLRTQSNLVAETNNDEDLVQGSIDSIDIQSGITYNFQYRRCNNSPNEPAPRPTPNPQPNPRPAPIPQPTPPPYRPVDQNIIGWIDSIQDLGTQGAVIHGWACAKNTPTSIDVHVYINGPAGRGQFVKAARASNQSEPAVAQQCQTQWSQHRFAIAFTHDEKLKYANSKIWVHGISPVNLPNHSINNSGNFAFPQSHKNIRGAISSVQAEGSGGNQVMGWACIIGQIRQLEIEVFIGGPLGSGTFAGSHKTVLQMDLTESDNTCGRFNPTGFAAIISKSLIQNNLNKPIFAYAIDPTDGEYHLLDGSGQVNTIDSPGDRF